MSSDLWSPALFDRIATAAAERGESARVKVWYYGRPDVAFTMEILDNKPRAVVDEALLGLLAKIDEKVLMARLADDGQRGSWKRWTAQINAMRGKTVTLFTATAAVAVPLGAPTRTTLNINVYHVLQVDPESLAKFLSPEELAVVRKLKTAPTLIELAEALGIQTEEEEEPGGGGGGPTPVDDKGKASDGDKVELPPAPVESDPYLGQFNLIFFGPPGTGKSFELAERVHKHLNAKPENVHRVTFHPEYTYFDFVGTYRPAVGWLATSAEFRKDGGKETDNNGGRSETVREEPRVYYQFSPGPLSLALAAAANQPGEAIVLIVEEINRGNCAAIFGDVFQLLDRGSDYEDKAGFGVSEYDIRPSSEWAGWLKAAIPRETPAWSGGKLRLPGNLYLYATMNTSDQSLFPMDTAFRRRWSMKYAPVKPKPTLPTKVPLRPGKMVLWRDLMVPVNARIVEHTGSDDKQMGPWFVKAPTKEREVTELEFQSKVLFYLWSEVFRDSPDDLFAPGIRTYDQLVDAYEDGKDIFQPAVYAAVEPKAPEVAPPEATPLADGSAVAAPEALTVPAASA